MSFQDRNYSSKVSFRVWAHTEQHRSLIKVDRIYMRLISLDLGEFRSNIELNRFVIVTNFYLVFKHIILKSAQKCPRLYFMTSLHEWQF